MNTEALKDPLFALIGNVRFAYWILQAVAMIVTCALIPKLKLTSFFGPLLMVVALSFINATIWNAALFFQLPNTFTTEALLLIGANGLIFWILVKILPGIEVEGILPALIAPLVFSLCSMAISEVDKRTDWHKVSTEALNFLGEAKKHFEQARPSGTPTKKQ